MVLKAHSSYDSVSKGSENRIYRILRARQNAHQTRKVESEGVDQKVLKPTYLDESVVKLM